MSKRLHPRRRIAGGTHRVTDPYGRDEAPYKGAEPYDVVYILLHTIILLELSINVVAKR